MDVNKDGGALELWKLVGMKTPKCTGKVDWEAFRARFELLDQASAWSG